MVKITRLIVASVTAHSSEAWLHICALVNAAVTCTVTLPLYLCHRLPFIRGKTNRAEELFCVPEEKRRFVYRAIFHSVRKRRA